MDNRQIDTMVAEKVMGWIDGVGERKELAYLPGKGFCFPNKPPYYSKDLPHYSTDIAAAWQVIEKMQEKGYWAQLRTPFGLAQCNDGYWCGFTPHLATNWNSTPDNWTNAVSQSLAICLAALKTVEDEIDE